VACDKPPELPSVPSIEFDKVEFVVADPGADSLIVYINFEDGDGDLGLRSDEEEFPYQPFNFITTESGELITFSSAGGVPSFNPIDWSIITVDGVLDTFRVEINQNHYNFEIDFFVKERDEFKEFNWLDAPYYQTFDGRFPILYQDDNEGPLRGNLRYGMTSNGFLPLFRNDTLQLKIRVRDRALNVSNTVESEAFTLAGIAKD
jgi:hypothetical protein